MAEQCAYSTADPDAVAAYRQERADLRAFGERVLADCAALGGVKGPLVRGGIWGSPDVIVALAPDDSVVVPDGWRLVRGRLEPRRGRPGEPARQWLADHQPPDVRHALTRHGLPRHTAIPADSGRFRMVAPALFELDGVLWACFDSDPAGEQVLDGQRLDGQVWVPRRLSEFHAAREELEARSTAEDKTEEVSG